jgi:hypothetical protein
MLCWTRLRVWRDAALWREWKFLFAPLQTQRGKWYFDFARDDTRRKYAQMLAATCPNYQLLNYQLLSTDLPRFPQQLFHIRRLV